MYRRFCAPMAMSTGWRCLPVVARALASELLRYADADGWLAVGAEPPHAVICRLMGAHRGERRTIRRALVVLEEAGFLLVREREVRITTPDVVTADRPPITAAMRQQVLRRFGRLCGICRNPIAPNDAVHIDHVVPLSAGGAHDVSNLQPSHASCNLRKGAR